MKTLATKYNHLDVEKDKYQTWIENGLFEANPKSDKPPFSIVIPPPNVTGKLHLGHAWDTTLQDIIIRMKKLQGYDTFWVTGMDHAGIATQAKVEERLREQGISRYDLGRDAFLDKAWEWKDEFSQTIKAQWGKLGLALDYSRERFTLDDGLSDAVRKVFVDLYNKGLIYQGERIINWDPKQKTALSNIEVIYKDIEGAEHYFKYRFADNEDEYLTIMTTRPETIFGDGAVAVHPDDERYQKYLGRKVIVPGTTIEIPIIADDYVEKDFGSGCVKITPAHDPNDFEVGKRHDVPERIIMDTDGTMSKNEWVPEQYQGLDRFACRKLFLENMKNEGLLIEVKPFIHSVGHSERSGVIVEPYLSKQWFVDMKKLSQTAIEAQANDNRVDFYPDRFEKTFLTWMEKVTDWCISRQLWWGHQIPAWYHKETKEVYVGMDAPTDIENWTQDEDVLDTWFSSALWPFSTLNWPNTDDELFKRYFPTNVLVTGYDIIFFWVSRMIFQSLEFTEKKPFNDVLIHGLVRAADGRKMSKSLGNGVDPMDVIEKYGADSLRYFLTTNTSPGQDLRYIEEKVESTWNFINKVWNATRFVLLHVTEETNTNFDFTEQSLNVADSWILSRLNDTIKTVNYNAEKYEFGEVGRALYNFIWDDFCDWYIEMSKLPLQGENEDDKSVTINVLSYVIESIVKLLHPFMPYVTEEIWEALPYTDGFLIESEWPKILSYINEVEGSQFEVLQNIIRDIRALRLENELPNSKAIKMNIKAADEKISRLLTTNQAYIQRFGNPETLTIGTEIASSEEAFVKIGSQYELIVPTEGLVDKEAERLKLEAERMKLESEIKRATQMLANPGFVAKAPADKVAAEQAKLEQFKLQLSSINERLELF
ncbi:MAG: valine--tRNA ligase [Culicoidibacterales bacterium]